MVERDNLTADQFQEEVDRRHKAVVRYCFKRLGPGTINRLEVERRATVLLRQGVLDIDAIMRSYENASSSKSLPPTLGPVSLGSELLESELQEFHTAHQEITLQQEEEEEEEEEEEQNDDCTEYESSQSLRVSSVSEPGPTEVMPKLRVVFEQLDMDAMPLGQPTHLPAEPSIQVFKVLGKEHGYAQTDCTLEVYGMHVTLVFIPWRDQVFLCNNSIARLQLTHKLDVPLELEVQPRGSVSLDPGYWTLQDGHTCVGLHIRSRRYALLLEIETKKRTAGAEDSDGSPSKVRRGLGERLWGREDSTRDGRHADIDLSETGKTLVRQASADEVQILASSGIPPQHTLHLVDKATDATEYSITRLNSWLITRKDMVIFKAVWETATKSQLVIVKMHTSTDSIKTTQQAIRRWKREVKVHCGLQHPCIASLHAFDARLLLLAVELKEAQDLGGPEWCHARRTPRAGFFKGTLADAWRICADMADALSYLGEKGIIHGDIKALNILYSKVDGVTLIDFGLGDFVSNGTRNRGGGTPWYHDYKEYGRHKTSDVFSLGIVMLYALGELSLPEWSREWDMHAVVRHGEGLPIRDAWFDLVEEKRSQLEARAGLDGPGNQGIRAAELGRIISRMLKPADARITARDLAREMTNMDEDWGTWDSE